MIYSSASRPKGRSSGGYWETSHFMFPSPTPWRTENVERNQCKISPSLGLVIGCTCFSLMAPLTIVFFQDWPASSSFPTLHTCMYTHIYLYYPYLTPGSLRPAPTQKDNIHIFHKSSPSKVLALNGPHIAWISRRRVPKKATTIDRLIPDDGALFASSQGNMKFVGEQHFLCSLGNRTECVSTQIVLCVSSPPIMSPSPSMSINATNQAAPPTI